MSTLKTNRTQLGQSGTATQNFTITAEAADGTMKIARGNAGATTQDILTVDAAGVASLPAGRNLLTLATVQNTTSGTSIDFTGIPSWAKRITVMFNGVSTNGTSRVQVQLGSGTIDATGYASQSSQFGIGVNTVSGSLVSTTGFVIDGYASAIATARSGSLVLALQNTNIWVAQGVVADTSNIVGVSTMAGAKTLSGALDRIRITTVNGTDTFDAGSVNIIYEG